MILRLLVSAITGVAALGILPSDALAMSVKFSWKGYQPCSTKSPAFIVSEVPSGTTQLVFKMVDKDVPTYPHGGGIIASLATAKFLRGPSRTAVRAHQTANNMFTNGLSEPSMERGRHWHQRPSLKNFPHSSETIRRTRAQPAVRSAPRP